MIKHLLMHTFGLPRGLLGRMGGRLMAESNRPCAVWAVDYLRVNPLEKVLEVGYGPGVAIEVLCSTTDVHQVCGVDPSEEMYRQASERNKVAIAEGRVELLVGAVENLPYPDETFDAALAINSFQLWEDQQKGLGEIRRTLKPGSQLLLCFTRHSRQGSTGLVASLEKAGYGDVVLHEDVAEWIAVAGRR